MQNRIVTALSIPCLLSASGWAAGAIVPSWSPTSATVFVPTGGTGSYVGTGTIATGDFEAVLVFDVSGSMVTDTGQTAPNGGRQRGDWARDGSNSFLDGLPDAARVGLTQFAGPSTVVTPIGLLGPSSPISVQRSTLRTAVNTRPRDGSTGTNIDNAIRFATTTLNAAGAAADSKHIVVVTDGEQTTGNAVAATTAALAAGVESVNTVGLPGSSATLLGQIATAGHGQFVDGTSLTNLIAGFTSILNNDQTLKELDVAGPGGLSVKNLTVTGAGGFAIPLPVVLGDNLFTVTATSNSGTARTATLHVQGVPTVPEPAGTVTAAATAVVANSSAGDASRAGARPASSGAVNPSRRRCPFHVASMNRLVRFP